VGSQWIAWRLPHTCDVLELVAGILTVPDSGIFGSRTVDIGPLIGAA